MAKSISVLFVTPEVYPFSKESGVADYCYSLSLALKDLGNDVRVAMPKYGIISERKNKIHDINRLKSIEIPIGETSYPATVKSSSINNPRSKVQAYITTNYEFFDSHKGIYHDMTTWKEYEDNAERFIYFCRSIIETCVILNWFPDIIHCHDWQTGVLPAMAKILYPKLFRKTKFVFTVHNFKKQGIYPSNKFELLGISANEQENFIHKKQFNFLKAGFHYSEVVTTVSKTYSSDILKDKSLSNGLDKVIKDKGDNFIGINTGIDTLTWSAVKDDSIKATYSGDIKEYKYDNKVELIHKFGLEYSPKTPLISMISRIDAHKGINFVIEAADELFKQDVQFVFLGQGDDELKTKLQAISDKYPEKFKVKFSFDDNLAHLMEAGSDLFLIPSDYEPCGLNFMYALSYGSLPVVHWAGALKEKSVDYFLNKEQGNSITFTEWNSTSMLEAINKGIELFKNKDEMYSLLERIIESDLKWGEYSKEFNDLYRKMLKTDYNS